MNKSGKSALEQLQQNSAETTWRIGRAQAPAAMLEDFPCCLMCRKFQISAGGNDRGSRTFFAGTAAASDMLEGPSSTSSRPRHVGKIDDHVWIEKLDLRTHLQAPPSPERRRLVALCQKLLTNAIRPVLKEVNITGALGHIAGAFF